MSPPPSSGAPDPRDAAAFAELEAKVVDAHRKLKSVRAGDRKGGKGEREDNGQPADPRPPLFPQAEASASAAVAAGRRAALTKAELEAVPADAPLHAAFGRAFLSGADRRETLADLDAAAAAAAAEVTRGRAAAAGLAAKVEGAEGELRELLRGAPALAAAVARGER